MPQLRKSGLWNLGPPYQTVRYPESCVTLTSSRPGPDVYVRSIKPKETKGKGWTVLLINLQKCLNTVNKKFPSDDESTPNAKQISSSLLCFQSNLLACESQGKSLLPGIGEKDQIFACSHTCNRSHRA